MQNETYKFDHEVFGKLEVVMYEDTPYFIANQVCTLLGYSNKAKAVQMHVKDKHKVLITNKNPKSILGLSIPDRGMYLLSEYGVYSLILKSKLPQAEQFQDWVVEEVLPTIRKTGGMVSDVNTFTDAYFSEECSSVQKIVKTAINRKKSNYYVYKVFVDGNLKYIGKGTKDRYLHAASGTSNNYELNKAHFEGSTIDTKIVKNGLSDYQARKLERELIASAEGLGITLFNIKGVKNNA